MHVLFGPLCFLASFLFFSGEFLFSEILLPAFGGAAHVWMTCVLFYGFVLLGSYYVVSLIRNSKRAMSLCILITLFLLEISFYAFKIILKHNDHPIWSVLWAMANSALIPLLILGMTTPLLQNIADADKTRPSKILLTLSNLGSLVGLLVYPLIADTFLGLEHRKLIWQFGTLGCSLTVLFLGMKFYATNSPAHEIVSSSPFPAKLRVRWFFYAFLSCLLMLAVTNFITHGLGSVPLLWMIPLAIYLGTFWMAFSERLSPRNTQLRKYGPIVWGILQLLSYAHIEDNTFLLHFRNYLFLFLATLIVNCEIYKRRPSQNLSSFYLILNLGGVGATVLVSLIIPQIDLSLSNVYLEFVMAIMLFAVFLVVRDYEKLKASRSAKVVLFCITLLILYQLMPTIKNELDSKRNFYGLVRVIEENGEILMAHGNTFHGARKVDPNLATLPLLYYHPKSGVGEAFSLIDFPKKVASIGLGAGSILYYAHPGDEWDLIEINQNVYDLALKHFKFLSTSHAPYRIEINDGRLALENSRQSYDLIVLDAFSSDSIPLHLLTREAFEIYLRRLRPGGLILLHLSNNYCDFLKVVAPIAHSLNLQMAYAKRLVSDNLGKSDSLWAVLSNDGHLIAKFKDEKHWDIPSAHLSALPVWTDDWQGLLFILNIF